MGRKLISSEDLCEKCRAKEERELAKEERSLDQEENEDDYDEEMDGALIL